MEKNWLKTHGKARKFQAGGAMAPAPEEGAPAGGGGPEEQLQAMLMEFAESQDPQLAVAICNMLLELMGGGAAAPEGGAPAPEAAPAPPMGRNGLRMTAKGPIFKK